LSRGKASTERAALSRSILLRGGRGEGEVRGLSIYRQKKGKERVTKKKLLNFSTGERVGK